MLKEYRSAQEPHHATFNSTFIEEIRGDELWTYTLHWYILEMVSMKAYSGKDSHNEPFVDFPLLYVVPEKESYRLGGGWHPLRTQ